MTPPESEAVLGGHGAGLHFEFLHGIHREVRVEIGVVAVRGDHAIDQQVVRGVGAAVDAPVAETGAAIGEAALHRSGVGVHIGRQQHQRESVAAVQGQLLHALVLDHLADGGVFRVDQRGFGRDLHRFAHDCRPRAGR